MLSSEKGSKILYPLQIEGEALKKELVCLSSLISSGLISLKTAIVLKLRVPFFTPKTEPEAKIHKRNNPLLVF
ncbi:hypothetical protein [Methanosarcina barkeri]|uniref:Uncharacterized protein n=2 Tax=Methanosarcina barkeri TaxID=2208 RepID=A0A0E3LNL4_METBA|nr:hypothetical protein [Methanosarcina barkeri]AKB54976.1 hypothetical protein MSBRM_1978 [Methanosarcina barkeri MS]AKB56954.1 hypothetical protein MSBR2_0438 [Methanosarcina barkeri 227]